MSAQLPTMWSPVTAAVKRMMRAHASRLLPACDPSEQWPARSSARYARFIVTVLSPTTPSMMFAGSHISWSGATKVAATVVCAGSASTADHAPIPITCVSPASLRNWSRDGPPLMPQPSSLSAVTEVPLAQAPARSTMLSNAASAQVSIRYTPACGAVKVK